MNKKIGLTILLSLVFILLSPSLLAESDATGDVYYFNGYDADVLWEFYGEKDTIDITDISQSVSGSDLTVSLTLKESISDEVPFFYQIYLYKDPHHETSYYAVDYSNGEGMASGNGDLAGYIDTNPEYVFSNDKRTVSYTFSDIDTNIKYKLKAYAVEHAESGVVGGEAWYDYAPESEAPYYSNGNEGGDGTPGFEILSLIVAIGAVYIFIRKI